ncbi:MAG TPA: peptidoglycan DD-metalloendopeptidase family protein [Vicinamibacterales bacterium]|nr:peptidoglycan DD-metalloendopeptidase family protein [Vicinamibacterales bacterium]
MSIGLSLSSRFGAAAVIVIALALVGIAGATGHRSSDLQQQAEDARGKAEQARQQEEALAGDIAAQSQLIDSVQEDIGGVQQELTQLEGELRRSRLLLRKLEEELAEKTRTLVRARKEIGTAQERLSERVVAIYTSNEPDAIAVALGAKSIDELIEILEVRSRVIEHDTSLVGDIRALRARVTRERARTRTLREKRAAETARIETRTNERRNAIATLVARRDALADLRSARERSLASVGVQRREWEAQANALEGESRRIASVIASPPPAPPSVDEHTATPSPTAPSSTGFIWPVQGTLVSPYGQRWGKLHSGIDIAAPAGTPIAASASGQVVYAGSMSGYGLLVVIQHGGGIATAYAHNSSISVSVGQSVAQGQTIAAVGCTGHCFGDHVHFEVRVNGSTVDPMGYL